MSDKRLTSEAENGNCCEKLMILGFDRCADNNQSLLLNIS
jgi:hypothetical protein